MIKKYKNKRYKLLARKLKAFYFRKKFWSKKKLKVYKRRLNAYKKAKIKLAKKRSALISKHKHYKYYKKHPIYNRKVILKRPLQKDFDKYASKKTIKGELHIYDLDGDLITIFPITDKKDFMQKFRQLYIEYESGGSGMPSCFYDTVRIKTTKK